ncbi:hypothetical protein BVRB_3g058150 isoform B [Beta vulgaris subsp. vulgaris]|nr:hypothetical protein BVRB_3g058150 isoform B [Beta vulgaris subsp. vulgaris]
MGLRTDNYSFLNMDSILSVTLLIFLGLQIVEGGSPSQIALRNCPEKCGNISIPYPFGIGDECHYKTPSDNGFFYNLSCNLTTTPPSLTYGKSIEVVNITLEGEFRINIYISYVCYNFNRTTPTYRRQSWMNMNKFTLSKTRNYIGAIGCDTYVWLNGTMSNTRKFRSGCMTICASTEEIGNSSVCSGIGCCLVSIPEGVTNIDFKIHSLNDQQYVQDFNPCSVAFVVAKDYGTDDALPFSVLQMLTQNRTFYRPLKFPVVYDWSLGYQNCREAQLSGEYLCKGNTTCIDWPEKEGYRCQCKLGFRGNPYLHDCQDINECVEENSPCRQPATCSNTNGNFTCICPQGYRRRNSEDRDDLCIAETSKQLSMLIIKIIGGIAGGLIISLIFAFWYNWQHGNRKLLKIREKFFHQNGGYLLQQKLQGRDMSVGHSVEMFTVEELKKATNNYGESSIIGRGGFGMVYKGTLSENRKIRNQVVAIKRSLKIDSSQVEQFINEIIALSQINNKNVVKLLGCCLETEVPSLVYEYISNGTLYDHLHDERKARFFTWDIRLKIATQVSEVLAYLHTTISIPIIHRDIKSANILLDDEFTAKVADFGASKLAPADQEQLATMVQGTCGYLDPEYMQTGELTEKSDVYSFGVVLVELLTGEKAICYAKPENERSLAVYFLRKVKEDRLFEILDDKITSDGAIEQFKEVAYLAKRCLKLKGEDRPAMKEVARELDRIGGIGSHPWSNNKGVLLEEESEYLLGQTQDVIKHGYGSNEAINDSLSSSQSTVVQLVALNDGR